MPTVAAVVPTYDGEPLLGACLTALRAQAREFDEIVVVDDGSRDASAAVAEGVPGVRVVRLGSNRGFAAAANAGWRAATSDLVALVNTDVTLPPDWLDRMVAALEAHPEAASVACKLVVGADPSVVDDAGDFLRRDGVCEQRGRARRDDGRWDTAGEAFSACAGAALYRREALEAVGGFDERLGMYLEDVELGLRLRLAGWGCRYEPVAALHAGAASAGAMALRQVPRNTLLVVARYFPARWLGAVAYRQAAWIWHAARERRLRVHLAGLASALPLLPAMLRERRAVRAAARVPIEVAVPARPFRGPRAGGHPAGVE